MHPEATPHCDHVATFARGAGVGVVATAVDLTTLALLVHALGVTARAASAPALALGVAVQFVGSKRVTFRNRDPNWVPQAWRFLLVEALGFAANLALFDLAARHVALPPLALRLVTTNVVYVAVCLPLWSRIFRSAPARAAVSR